MVLLIDKGLQRKGAKNAENAKFEECTERTAISDSRRRQDVNGIALRA